MDAIKDPILLFQCPKPVVAAIHGVCVGGGTNMVTFADIRYCTNDAWFQVKEAALGLAADVGALQRLSFFSPSIIFLTVFSQLFVSIFSTRLITYIKVKIV
mgnify:CR=1 FL=1